MAPRLGGHCLEEHHLGPAEDLQAAGLKIVVKPDQLQRGAVHVRDRKRLLLIARGLIEDLQIEFLHQLAELGRVASDFFHIFPHNPAEVSRRRVNLVAIILYIIAYAPLFRNTHNPAQIFSFFFANNSCIFRPYLLL